MEVRGYLLRGRPVRRSMNGVRHRVALPGRKEQTGHIVESDCVPTCCGINMRCTQVPCGMAGFEPDGKSECYCGTTHFDRRRSEGSDLRGHPRWMTQTPR